MNINLSALQSKQSGAAQRDTSVVQHQLLWCRRAVSTAQECCVTTSAILVTLHFQLMLISHGKGLFDQVRGCSSGVGPLHSDDAPLCSQSSSDYSRSLSIEANISPTCYKTASDCEYTCNRMCFASHLLVFLTHMCPSFAEKLSTSKTFVRMNPNNVFEILPAVWCKEKTMVETKKST